DGLSDPIDELNRPPRLFSSQTGQIGGPRKIDSSKSSAWWLGGVTGKLSERDKLDHTGPAIPKTRKDA
ncbi:MAG: hypothetical protein OTI35_18650, partial [Sulfitobacter sp.]|nr:hypothetical protein [Sulfitobacter sp.]